MNLATLKSIVWKVVPVIATWLVGRGLIDEQTAEAIPGVLDAAIIVAAFIPTLIRSIKTHRDGK